jgi:hypothetical protein
MTRFHSASWQDSIPVLLPLRDGLKEPRYDGVELHGANAGKDAVANADGRQFRCINLPSVTQPENRKNIWVRLVGKREMPPFLHYGLESMRHHD